MPLPADSTVVETSKAIVEALHSTFGDNPGWRPAHAKGILLEGTFTPSEEAKTLTRAPHFRGTTTPILARLSNMTGIPDLNDTDPAGNPRGLAVRFNLASTPRRQHTDIVAHSTDLFPGSTAADALAFFRAMRDGTIDDYLASHPRVLAAAKRIPNPSPASFSTESFFGVVAFKFISADGTANFVRYRILPEKGVKYLDGEALKSQSRDYLYDELPGLLAQGPIVYKLVVQVAEPGDITNDNLEKWPETRQLVELGTIELTGIMADQEAMNKYVIFDPVPRIEGIEPSDDPLLDLRAGVYLISGRERRAA